MPVLKMSDLDLREKRVFMRVDFNIPIQDGKIADHVLPRRYPGTRHVVTPFATKTARDETQFVDPPWA